MQKFVLANSFCRCLKFMCDSLYLRPHVKYFTNLSCSRKTCITEKTVSTTYIVSIQPCLKLSVCSCIRKKSSLKKTHFKTCEFKKLRQMSESSEPTYQHATCGGQFEISTASETWNDIGQFSKFESENVNKRLVGQIPKNFRVWEQLRKKRHISDGSCRFKILSYNVLAQYLLECHPYLYTECDPRNLKWKVRSARLYDEIVNLAPDILCLQEVQATHIESFYEKFEQIGYYGIFKRKTGPRHDGCAIYFKKSLFRMEDYVTVEFYQPEIPILNRDNIGIIVKLVPTNSPNTPIIIATTHLLYNPKRTDVRLAQMQVFLAEIDRFAYYDNGRESGHYPVILTGDFNSTPDSVVVQLLDKGRVRASSFRDNSDWKRIGVTDNCQHLTVYLNRSKGLIMPGNVTKIYNSDNPTTQDTSESSTASTFDGYDSLFNSGLIGHSLKLTSVYKKTKSDGHLEATTFQDEWVTVDYIYFSRCRTLQLVEKLRLPTASECNVLGQLPNDVYGSDHLALAAVFQLTTVKSSL